MEARLIRGRDPFPAGVTTIVKARGREQPFSIVRLAPGTSFSSAEDSERLLMLLGGSVAFQWDRGSARASRASLLDEPPCALHAPAGAAVSVESAAGAELSLHTVRNGAPFDTAFLPPLSCRSELRRCPGLRQTADRIVRTLVDDTSAPHSNLVLGEVVTPPGHWSSYPPHYHPQPEIYHYRFFPAAGFGLSVAGDAAMVVRAGDTVVIPPHAVHPQTSAPGYAGWYLWCIRHLDGQRYRAPVFEQEHAWTLREEAVTWQVKDAEGRVKR
jgi:5-deoxy-glucuronate isomerase